MSRSRRMIVVYAGMLCVATLLALALESALAAPEKAPPHRIPTVISTMVRDATEVPTNAALRGGARSPTSIPAISTSNGGTLITTRMQATGAVVPGVAVVVCGPGSTVLLGTTDSSGHLRTSLASWTSPFESWLTVASDEFACEGVPCSNAAELELLLVPGTVVHGRVIERRSGDRGVADVTVLAVPSREGLTLAEAERTRVSRGRHSLARSDAAGRFRIQGVPRGEKVSLVAGGHGYCSPEPAVSFATQHNDPGAPDADASSIDVPVIEVVGARIQLVERGAGPIRVPLGCDPVPGVTFRTPKNGLRHIDWRGPSLVLAGLAAADLEASPPTAVLLFENSQGLTASELDLVLVPHGYRYARTAVPLASIASGLSTHVVSLEARGRGHGSLDLVFRAPVGAGDGAPDGLREPGILGTVKILSTDADYDTGFSYVVRSPLPAGVVLNEIPLGEYSLQFTPEHGLFTVALGKVSVDGTRRQVTVDLRETDGKEFGTLRIGVTDDGGHSYSGPLQVELRPRDVSGHANRRGSMIFKRAPYELRMVPSGELEIIAGRFSDFGRDARPKTTTTIRPRELRIVDMVLPPERQ